MTFQTQLEIQPFHDWCTIDVMPSSWWAGLKRSRSRPLSRSLPMSVLDHHEMKRLGCCGGERKPKRSTTTASQKWSKYKHDCCSTFSELVRCLQQPKVRPHCGTVTCIDVDLSECRPQRQRHKCSSAGADFLLTAAAVVARQRSALLADNATCQILSL